MFNICKRIDHVESETEIISYKNLYHEISDRHISLQENLTKSTELQYDFLKKFKLENQSLLQKTKEIKSKSENYDYSKNNTYEFAPNLIKISFFHPKTMKKEEDDNDDPETKSNIYQMIDDDGPLIESKINKNLYADYILKLKRLTIKERKKIEKKMIKEFIFDETCSTQYYINIDWAVDYTSFLDNHENNYMRPLDNNVLLEQNYQLKANLLENEHFVLINEKTWILLMKLYNGGPSIKLKENGSLIVSNETTILYSTIIDSPTNNEKKKKFWEEEKTEEDRLIEKEETIAAEEEKLIKFDKNKNNQNFKKLKILTGGPHITDGDNPQSSTSLDSHSTSFSKEEKFSSSAEKSKKSSPHSIKIIGLTNSSNYCFLNSGLQCLFSLEKLNEYFLSEQYKEKKMKTIKPAKYINIYSDALKLINSSNNNSEQPNKKTHSNFINAASLFKNLLKKVFNPREQQDIHEFIRLFLSEIQDELNPILDKNLSSQSTNLQIKTLQSEKDIKWETHLKNNTSIIDSLFSSQILTTVQCLDCKKSNRIYEIFLDFSLPILKNEKKKDKNDGGNIYNCLNKFFEDEIMNEYRCNFCKKIGKSKKSMSISKPPQILLLHLKRFKMYPRKQKLSEKIDFPLMNLDIKKYCINSNEQTTYSLKCFASHIGTEDYGHYVAFALRENKWYFFNDEDVKPIEEENIPKKEAYLLFYEKIV